MSDVKFAAGDLVKVTLVDPSTAPEGAPVAMYLDVIPKEFENPESDLLLYHSESGDAYELIDLFEDPDVRAEVIAHLADRLPSEAGTYIEPAHCEFCDEATWIRNVDGTWTDQDGVTKPAHYNWALVVGSPVEGNGFIFQG